MRITIDEEMYLVHAQAGAVTLTLAMPRALKRGDLEAAAEGLRAALQNARAVVVNGEPIKL